MSQNQPGLQFRSASEFLQQVNVQTAIYEDSDIAQLAHQFDALHLDVESGGDKHAKATKKQELIAAVAEFDAQDSEQKQQVA
jgi:hypothetical protein